MAWLGTAPTGIVTSKRTDKTLKASVTVSGTPYKLFQKETVEITEYRGLTYSAANAMVISTTYNYDNFVFSNWVTGLITHVNAKIDGSKSNAAFSRKFESDGYTVTVTKTTLVSSTS